MYDLYACIAMQVPIHTQPDWRLHTASHYSRMSGHIIVRGVPVWLRVEGIETLLYPPPVLEVLNVCTETCIPRSGVLQHLSRRPLLKKRQLGRVGYLGCSLTTTAVEQRLWCCVHCRMSRDAGHAPWGWLLHLTGVSVQTLVGMSYDCRNTKPSVG